METGDFLLDYERLDQILVGGADQYRRAQPFPHMVIDELVPLAAVRELVSRFPDNIHDPATGSEDVDMDGGQLAQYRKGFLSREGLVDIAFRRVYWELNNGPFVEFLEALTGIEGLIGNPYMLGGGVHEILHGGFLRVHADFNQHDNLALERRLNVLLYLNEDWLPEYGGTWNYGMSRSPSVSSVLRRWRAAALFSTPPPPPITATPHPLQCPPDRSRQSIALYYYTNERQPQSAHETLWQKLPAEQ